MKLGTVPIRAATIVLTFILVASAVVGAVLLQSELQTGGMRTSWVSHPSVEAAYYDAPLFLAKNGSIIVYEFGHVSSHLLSLSSSNGAVEWRFPVNSRPSPIQGPDGGFYYVDWPDESVWRDNASKAGFRNLTVLNSNGGFEWDFATENGTLEIWGIYSDGEVVALHEIERYDSSRQQWEFVKDEIVGILDGTQLWSMEMPLLNSSWGNPGVVDNGTFVVHAHNYDDQARYEVGISKNGEILYIQKGNFFVGYPVSPHSQNGTVEYEVRQEYVDSETSVINVYAISMVNGSTLWKTELYQSDNPDHMPPGSWSNGGTLVDPQGRIFCDARDAHNDKYSYGLNSAGDVLWRKPFLGLMIAPYPSGGFLLADEVSLKKIDDNGSQVWRHYGKLDGFGDVLLGQDEAIYYGIGTSVVALNHSRGLSMNMTFLLVIAGTDIVVVSVYVLRLRRLRHNQDA
jgi:PQQ-like domain